MRRNSKLPELLAPAGDITCLYAAVEAGADAVYVGGRAFGARAYAKNFDSSELKHAVEYCHLHGVKLYVTVNTLVYDKEMAELFVKRILKTNILGGACVSCPDSLHILLCCAYLFIGILKLP